MRQTWSVYSLFTVPRSRWTGMQLSSTTGASPIEEVVSEGRFLGDSSFRSVGGPDDILVATVPFRGRVQTRVLALGNYRADLIPARDGDLNDRHRVVIET
jgi:hypothetical protein